MTSTTAELAGYTVLSEPDLIFAGNNTNKHPLVGLIDNGPYGLKFGAPSSLRLAVLAPRRDKKKLFDLIQELKSPAKPKEAPKYYPVYPGFEPLFRIPIADVSEHLVLEFPDELDAHAARGAKVALARDLFQCIAQLKQLRTSFDVALIYLPPTWAECFQGESFDFHDYLKAYSAPSNIRIQIIRQTSLDRECRANVMWGLERRALCQSGRRPLETDRPYAERSIHWH